MDAERALHTLNGKKIYEKEVKVNWAAHSNKDETTSKYFIFFCHVIFTIFD